MLFVLLCSMWLLLPLFTSAATEDVTKSAKVTTGGTFKTTSAGIRYQLSNGTYVKSSWRKIGGKIYRFNAKSYCETGWFTYQKASYYANNKGQIYINKWKKSKGLNYYLQQNGQMAANKQLKIDGYYYFFDPNGVMVSTIAIPIQKDVYFFDENGRRVANTWIPFQGNYYYFGASGAMAFNQWVGDYYVGEDGARKKNCVVDGIELDENGKKKNAGGKYIFYGDSRMVEMKNSVKDSSIEYIGTVGANYDWAVSTGDAVLKACLKKDPAVKVVLAFGVNDLGNIDNYIRYYQSLIKAYTGTKFYVLAVNPVDEAKEALHGFVIKNEKIKDFNRKMKASFASCYLPSYGYLNGIFETRDGVHYTEATYQKLYEYIMSKIK